MTAPAPLVEAADVAAYRGAPFGSDLLAAASGAARSQCGWHIAPRHENHTVLVSGPTGRRLVLPTLRIVEVTRIRDVRTDTEVTGWRIGSAGMLVREAGWPCGEDNLEVELTHGFETCPPEVVAVVVERARALASTRPVDARQFARTVGGVSTTTAFVEAPAAWSLSAAAILDRYTV